MKTLEILQLANDCAYVREYVHNVKYHSNMLGDEFSRVCKHLNYYKRVNIWLNLKYNQRSKQYAERLNQLISRAPVIKFWS